MYKQEHTKNNQADKITQQMPDITMQKWRSDDTPERIKLTRMYSVMVEGTIGK
jgi:hypothetical protein